MSGRQLFLGARLDQPLERCRVWLRQPYCQASGRVEDFSLVLNRAGPVQWHRNAPATHCFTGRSKNGFGAKAKRYVSRWNGLTSAGSSLDEGIGSMLHTMTTADWLRRAADAWDEADAIQDRKASRTKVTLAEEYERLAKHAAYLAHYESYACCMTGENRIDILIERNHDLLEHAEAARRKAQQLKAEHLLITARALETRPLVRSNRHYRRIAMGKHDALVLMPHDNKQPRPAKKPLSLRRPTATMRL